MSKKVSTNIVLVLTIIALVVMIHLGVTHLWNALMPKIFGLPTVNGWELFGLMIVVRWIFPAGAKISKDK